FYYLNLHLDYNIANTNSFFPFFEMNWIHYTRAGTSTNLGFEGADLINFGSMTRQGRDWLALAPGLRYRFSDNIFAGAPRPFPVPRGGGPARLRPHLRRVLPLLPCPDPPPPAGEPSLAGVLPFSRATASGNTAS